MLISNFYGLTVMYAHMSNFPYEFYLRIQGIHIKLLSLYTENVNYICVIEMQAMKKIQTS